MRLFSYLSQNVSKLQRMTQSQWLEYYSQFHPSPVSIKQFIDFGEYMYVMTDCLI